ncbi:D-glucuronyl C5-epimerase family protein [Vibrio apostichopi]|uniref:D-glucuronyl C5-epimerase family protein n=1 Tax=Vibrio apostichopi TaxID=3035453 RepID=UPI002573AC68|nr:D-glucuronyl C5-epimerase family protein [Vibrio sp. FE10]
MSRLFFYIKKGFADLFNPLIYSPVYGEDTLQYYYLKYELPSLLDGRSQKFSFDDNNIPIIPHYIDSSSKKEGGEGFHYYPIAIGQLALAYLHDYLDSKKADSLTTFLTYASWFVDNQEDNGTWLAQTNVDKYGVEAPWVSAMTQGRALSVLLRAYRMTGDNKYLDSASLAFEALLSDSSFVKYYKEGLFLLEYPSKSTPRILNGFIFALYGIVDFSRAVPGDERCKEILESSRRSLLEHLPLYDNGFWSVYDLDHIDYQKTVNISTVHYHFIHISQLRTLADIYDDSRFNEVATRWDGYYRNKLSLFRIYFVKARRLFKL